jgi:hypothetical protein
MVTCRSIISDNVSGVSEVPSRRLGIWAEARSAVARYTVLYALVRDEGAIATEESWRNEFFIF